MSKHKPRLRPEQRAKAERLLELNDQHLGAIRGEDEAFYTDGRHEELRDLVSEIHEALGIAPSDDDDPIIRAALNEAEENE